MQSKILPSKRETTQDRKVQETKAKQIRIQENTTGRRDMETREQTRGNFKLTRHRNTEKVQEITQREEMNSETWHMRAELKQIKQEMAKLLQAERKITDWLSGNAQ